MAVPIVLPDLGAKQDPIRVGGWLVEPGQSVAAGDRVVEVGLPGIVFDVAAPVDGTLAGIERRPSSVVRPGDVLGWIEPDEPTDEH